MQHYIPTGNDYVSIPKLSELTGCIEDITFLMMSYKGMIELRGSREIPLMIPTVEAGGESIPLTDISFTREHYWIPKMTAKAGDRDVIVTYLSPVGHRGFGIRMTVKSEKSEEIRMGLRGAWDTTYHCINQDKKVDGKVFVYPSGWNGSIIFDMRAGLPIFSFAPVTDKNAESKFELYNDGQATKYSVMHTEALEGGTESEFTIYWGFGYEEVSAATSAVEMDRMGWDFLYDKMAKYLDDRIAEMPTPKLKEIYNTNLFFCIFFSTGLSIDTEELCCVTSRSTRYYVSAAYWDRDVLLWSYPGILDADAGLALDILRNAFTRQHRNVGIHSHYIDGTLLEPGFELDELMAPIVALNRYVLKTGDSSVLSESIFTKGIERILKLLEEKKHPTVDLYETFLQPTDDPIVYPYLTYDNVLVWYSFDALSKLYPEKYAYLSDEAKKVKKAITENCLYKNGSGRDYYAWSVNLKGDCNVYDEPPGSLQLLPYFGFTSEDDEAWANTIDMIRSPDYYYSFAGHPISEIGCAHVNHPWILSFCNSMLSGHAKRVFEELELLKMDNGIACESIHEDNGECTSGGAFATCAGFLCHAMRQAYDKKLK